MNEARLRALQDDAMQVVLDALVAAHDHLLAQVKSRPSGVRDSALHDKYAQVWEALNRLDPASYPTLEGEL
jgi:hypothetical protein